MAFDVGDVVTLDFAVRVDNTLTDPSTLTLTVTAPDGTSTTPSPVHVSTGTYSHDLLLDQVGKWSYRWVTQGVGQAADEGVLYARPAGSNVISLADVKQHLQITTAKHDDELAGFLAAAARRLQYEVGPLGRTTVTDEVHSGPGPLILHQTPVLAVTSISDSGSTVTDFDLDAATGIVYRRDDARFTCRTRAIRVSYEAGYAELPDDLRLAVLELTRHLWTSQRGAGAGGARANLVGGDGVDPTTAAGLAAYTLPFRVVEMIAPYRLAPVIC